MERGELGPYLGNTTSSSPLIKGRLGGVRITPPYPLFGEEGEVGKYLWSVTKNGKLSLTAMMISASDEKELTPPLW